jgi:hypothetical protein
MEWAAFEQVSGPILPQERIDVAAATIAYITAISHGAKKVRFKDFLFQWDHKPMSEDQAAAALGMALEAAVSQPSPHSSSTS